MHRLSRRLVSALALAALAVPVVATEAAAATPGGTTAKPAASTITGNGHHGGAVPMTAPCSGVGTAIPGTYPTEYWNGCVDASAGLNARKYYGTTDNVTGTEPIVTTYPFGTKVHITCYVRGVWVTGYDGLATNIWDNVDEFMTPSDSNPQNYGPHTFLIVSTDAWIYTGSDNAVVPHC